MAEEEQIESLKLGGNIELSGFRDVDPRAMIILKKIIGNYVRKFTDHFKGFVSINIHLKEISKKQGNLQYELNANLDMGKKKYNSEETGRNIFVSVDALFKNLEKELSKK